MTSKFEDLTKILYELDKSINKMVKMTPLLKAIGLIRDEPISVINLISEGWNLVNEFSGWVYGHRSILSYCSDGRGMSIDNNNALNINWALLKSRIYGDDYKEFIKALQHASNLGLNTYVSNKLPSMFDHCIRLLREKPTQSTSSGGRAKTTTKTTSKTKAKVTSKTTKH